MQNSTDTKVILRYGGKRVAAVREQRRKKAAAREKDKKIARK